MSPLLTIPVMLSSILKKIFVPEIILTNPSRVGAGVANAGEIQTLSFTPQASIYPEEKTKSYAPPTKISVTSHSPMLEELL
jgi:hypothetical protein